MCDLQPSGDYTTIGFGTPIPYLGKIPALLEIESVPHSIGRVQSIRNFVTTDM